MKAPRFKPPAGSRFFIGSDPDKGTARFNIDVPIAGGKLEILGPDGNNVPLAHLSREVSESEFWAKVSAAGEDGALETP
jgi:hypothetical protein